MMGRRKVEQGQLFYAFDPESVVPEDHQVRRIAVVLDLSWVRAKLAPYYSHTGRPSIDPELMIRMLILGYVFAIRSERALCREVQVNLAYRWFCVSASKIRSPTIPPSRVLATSAFASMMSFAMFSSASSLRASRLIL
jgi:transposase